MTYLLTQKETGRSVDLFLCFLVQSGDNAAVELVEEGRKQTNWWETIICHSSIVVTKGTYRIKTRYVCDPSRSAEQPIVLR